MKGSSGHAPRPLMILAGGAQEDEAVPGESDRIVGPKGITIRLGGRPLIDVVVERFAATGSFDPILVCGPADRYGEKRGAAIVVDTNLDFAGNIRAGLAAIPKDIEPGPVFFASCDVIPEVEELQRVMADYYAHLPCDFWYPQVRVPADKSELGSSAYKRTYRIIPDGEKKAVETLPGHLVAIDPECVRTDLFLLGFELAYRSRTRHVAIRFLIIFGGGLLQIVLADIRALLSGRLPYHLLEIFYHGFRLSYGLARASIDQSGVAYRAGSTFSKRSHRKRYPDRGGRIPLVEALSLARDIDTESEAVEYHLEVRA
jgi:hypothetical protein